ncbi:MAG: threonine synthase [Planctomycetota bacterium]
MVPNWVTLRSIDADSPREYPADRTNFLCDATGSLLDAVYDFDAAHAALGFARDPRVFEDRHRSGFGVSRAGDAERAADYSGVWRFRELMPFWSDVASIATAGEGRTILQRNEPLASHMQMEGVDLLVQYEGLNPTGSFKDNGMTGAFTHARAVGAKRVVCASTGNTSAALAMYAAASGLAGYVLVGSGKIAFGKLSQALDYGATTLQVAGDFDACLKRVREVAFDRPELGVYLMNSINPFRLEGQKAIMFRVVEALGWESPDWIVVPGGNLGNSSAFGKAFIELKALGMIEKVPRLAIINAQGASTLDRIYNDLGVRWQPSEGGLDGSYDKEKVDAEFARMDAAGENAETVATAIQINRPVNLPKALRALEFMDGVVMSVDDRCILEHKALVGRFGFGCEPASAASVAGARRLFERGVIRKGERVVCILTGHVLKDPDATVSYHVGAQGDEGGLSIPLGCAANGPVVVADDLESIVGAMQSAG